MPPSSDIYLVGAGYSPHTKIRRMRSSLPQRRSFYIGTIQIMPGLRFPVDVDFLKKHHDEIARRVEAGTLIVEYKHDTYVDGEELRTLAFGSDTEKEAYEQEVAAARDDKVQEQAEAAAALQAEKDEAAVLSVLGTNPAQRALADSSKQARDEGDATEDEEGTGVVATDNATRLSPGTYDTLAADGALDNLEGSHETAFTSPRDAADQAARDYYQKHPVDTESVGEPALRTAKPRNTESDATFKPLPDGWQKAPKPELLAWCTERGIDTSDMPSNKELRKRLDAYLTEG